MVWEGSVAFGAGKQLLVPVNVRPNIRSWFETSCLGVMVSVTVSFEGSILGSLAMSSSSAHSSCLRRVVLNVLVGSCVALGPSSLVDSEGARAVRSNLGRSMVVM